MIKTLYYDCQNTGEHSKSLPAQPSFVGALKLDRRTVSLSNYIERIAALTIVEHKTTFYTCGSAVPANRDKDSSPYLLQLTSDAGAIKYATLAHCNAIRARDYPFCGCTRSGHLQVCVSGYFSMNWWGSRVGGIRKHASRTPSDNHYIECKNVNSPLSEY